MNPENRFRYIVEGPKHLERDFMHTIENFPNLTLTPVGDEAMIDIAIRQQQDEKDREWHKERESLAFLVEEVVWGALNEDPVVLSNFNKFYKMRVDMIARWGNIFKKSISLEDFAYNTIRIFKQTSDAYQGIDKSPKYFNTSKKGNRITMYRRPEENLLNPREIRLIIWRHGLNGQPAKSLDVLADEEEIHRQRATFAEEELLACIFRTI